jgi:ribosome-associated translation inhibitor RaiA
MMTRYDVSYRNMWPSDALNQRVRDDSTQLLRRIGGASACRVWIERAAEGTGLTVRVELETAQGTVKVERSLKAAKKHEQVCAAIDSAFNELMMGLPSPAVAA